MLLAVPKPGTGEVIVLREGFEGKNRFVEVDCFLH